MGILETFVSSPSPAIFTEPSKRLDDRHIGDAAAFAHRLQAKALAARAQPMDHSRHQLGPARAERMAKRNRAAIDVEPFGIGTDLLEPSQRYRSKRLIHLVKVDLVELPTRPLQRPS